MTIDQTYPPDPHWGVDARGHFRYMDYDGESLKIYRNTKGDLWIDKQGEGPVFIRQEDIPIILDAINDPRTPAQKCGRRVVKDNPQA